MISKFNILVLISSVIVPYTGNAIELPGNADIEKIKQNWKCKYCPYEDAPLHETVVTATTGNVDNDSFIYDDRTGLKEKGSFVAGSVEHRSRQEDSAGYLQVDAENIGLDTSSVELRTGVQGKYDVKAFASQTDWLVTESAYTPYSNGNDKSLPAGWVKAADTSGFSLSTTLARKDVNIKRTTYGVDADYRQNDNFSYQLTARHNEKEGVRTVGAALGNGYTTARSVLLLEPVGFTTDDFSAALRFQNANFYTEARILFSFFKNDNKFTRWENAYNTPVEAPEGQKAQEPDNQMTQVSLAGAYHFSADTQLTAHVSGALLTQDDTFLPYTISSDPPVTSASLPVNSLDGKVTKTNADLQLISNFSKTVRGEIRLSEEDYNSDTTSQLYRYNIMDTDQTTADRANLPYGYNKQSVRLKADYIPSDAQRGYLSAESRTTDRNYQESSQMTEQMYHASYSVKILEMTDVGVRVGMENRTAKSYTPLDVKYPAENFPRENYLLRKFNLADRDRTQYTLNMTTMLSKYLDVGLIYDNSEDKYSNSVIGLTNSKEDSVTINIGLSNLVGGLRVSGYFTNSGVDSSQAGREAAAGTPADWSADWKAKDNVEINTAGLDVSFTIENKKLEFGLNLISVDASSQVKLNTSPAPAAGFADMKSTRNSWNLYAKKGFTENLELQVAYFQEKFEVNDWTIDGVDPDTMLNVLSTGEIAPNYKVEIISAGVKYRF